MMDRQKEIKPDNINISTVPSDPFRPDAPSCPGSHAKAVTCKGV